MIECVVCGGCGDGRVFKKKADAVVGNVERRDASCVRVPVHMPSMIGAGIESSLVVCSLLLTSLPLLAKLYC